MALRPVMLMRAANSYAVPPALGADLGIADPTRHMLGFPVPSLRNSRIVIIQSF
jgi:hypothetical protein